MGSSELLSEATPCIKHIVNQLIKHNHTQLSDMNKTFLGKQNEMTRGKATLHEQICFQEMFLGFPEVKMASSNPQIVDLFFHPLGITRNRACNQKWPSKKWENIPLTAIQFSETSMGFTWAKTDSTTSQKSWVSSPIRRQPKWHG